MKKLLALMLIFSMFFVMGCSEDDVDEFDTLVTYLEGENGGYINNMGSWILGAGVLNRDFDYSAYTVLDLRSADAFATKSIPGAINVTLTNMFEAAEAATKPILVTCYSGQTASFAHTLLQLKGYAAYVMKFGMSVEAEAPEDQWDKWTVKCSDAYAADLIKTASPTLPSFDYPELDTGEEDAEDILEARMADAIAAWGTTLTTAAAVISAPTNYNIINYWVVEDYLGHGHITGSYQVTPNTLTMDENLSVLDPDGGNVLYCYTGQTAAASIAYLALIGYDVQSIAYGFNSMHWTELPGHKWPKPTFQ